MINKIKIILVILATFSVIAVPVAVSASSDTVQQGLTCGAQLSASTTGCSPIGSVNATSSVSTLVDDVINIFSWLVGSISIIMVIYGGFRYVTSGGNDSSISGAKNTIVYALIGLVIVALAQIIVHFVLSKALSVGSVIYSTHLFR